MLKQLNGIHFVSAILAIIFLIFIFNKLEKSPANTQAKPIATAVTFEASSYVVRMSGVTYRIAQQIVSDFIDLYSKDSPIQASFRTASVSPNATLVGFSKNIDFDLFCFFVNYATYPKGVDLKTIKHDVKGWGTYARINNDGFDNEQPKLAMFFIDPQDYEYDVIWLTSQDNQTWKLPFSDPSVAKKIPEIIYTYESPPVLTNLVWETVTPKTH